MQVLRLHDNTNSSSGGGHTINISSEIPFSMNALRSMQAMQQAMTAQPAPSSSSSVPLVASQSRANDRAFAQRLRAYGDPVAAATTAAGKLGGGNDCCERAFRVSQWIVLIIAFAFIAVVVALLSVVLVKVGEVMHEVGDSSLHEQLTTVLNHATSAAMHTETATANAAAMSVMAKAVVADAHPRVMNALNQTSDMMAELREFSVHPQWTIAAGGGGSGSGSGGRLG